MSSSSTLPNKYFNRLKANRLQVNSLQAQNSYNNNDELLLKSKNDSIVKLCNAFGTKTEIIQSKENHKFDDSVCNYFILSGIPQENMEANMEYFSIIATNQEYSAFKSTNLIVLEGDNKATCGCEQPPTRGVVQPDGSVLWEQLIFACYPSVTNFNKFNETFGPLFYLLNGFFSSPQGQTFSTAISILDKIDAVKEYIKLQPAWDQKNGPYSGYPGVFMDIVFLSTYSLSFTAWNCLVNVAETNGAYSNNCSNTWYNFDLSVTEIGKEGVSYDSTALYTYNQNEWLVSSFMANKSGSYQGTSCGNSHATTPDPTNPSAYTVNKKFITTVNVSFGAQDDSSSAPTQQIKYLNNPIKKFFGKYKCNTATKTYQEVVAARTDPKTSSLIDTNPLLPADFKLGDIGDPLYPNTENYQSANYTPSILDINKSICINPLKAFSLSTPDLLQPAQGILNNNGITEDLHFATTYGSFTYVIKHEDNTIINPVFNETFNIFKIIKSTEGDLYMFTDKANSVTVLEQYLPMAESPRELICWRLSDGNSVLDGIKCYYGNILLEDYEFYSKLSKNVIYWQQTGHLVDKWSFGQGFSYGEVYSDMYRLAEEVNFSTVTSNDSVFYNNAIRSKTSSFVTSITTANVPNVTEEDFTTLLGSFGITYPSP